MVLRNKVVESLERVSYLNFSSTPFVYSPKVHTKDYKWELVLAWDLDLGGECREVSAIQQQVKN